MKALRMVRLGVAVAGVLLAGTVLAQDGGPGFGGHRPPMERAFDGNNIHGRWWNNPRVVAQLKLTDEQRKAFDGILLEHREKLIDLRAGVEKAELSLEPLIRDDQPNEAKILSQIDKVAQARAELEKANARYLLAIRARLTPEQWKQVQLFRANQEQKRRDDEASGNGRRGHGGGNQGQRGQYHGQAPPPPPPDGNAPAPPPEGAPQ